VRVHIPPKKRQPPLHPKGYRERVVHNAAVMLAAQALEGRILLNRGTAERHPDAQVRHDAQVRQLAYQLALADVVLLYREGRS
jgi:hypothetical protein